MLRDSAQIFLDRITDPEMVALIPRELRYALEPAASIIVIISTLHMLTKRLFNSAIAAYTAKYARKFAPDQSTPLVGSFMFLRFACPSLS